MGRSGGGRKIKKKNLLSVSFVYTELWRQLSDNMEGLMTLKEDLDYLTVSKIKQQATPHRATWETTSVGEEAEGARAQPRPEPLSGFPRGRQGRTR